jgi:hypothetical protein
MKNIKDYFGKHRCFQVMQSFVRDIHYSRTQEDMVRVWNDFYKLHCNNTEYQGFLVKMSEEWSSSNDRRWWRWQLYQTPTGIVNIKLGYATTNNPLEQYNKDLKTLLGKVLLQISFLLKELCKVIKLRSEQNMSFEIDCTIPSVRMATRAKALHKMVPYRPLVKGYL